MIKVIFPQLPETNMMRRLNSPTVLAHDTSNCDIFPLIHIAANRHVDDTSSLDIMHLLLDIWLFN
jgi:hypothetical protein